MPAPVIAQDNSEEVQQMKKGIVLVAAQCFWRDNCNSAEALDWNRRIGVDRMIDRTIDNTINRGGE